MEKDSKTEENLFEAFKKADASYRAIRDVFEEQKMDEVQTIYCGVRLISGAMEKRLKVPERTFEKNMVQFINFHLK